MNTHEHVMPFGASLLESGGVTFRLWAPAAGRVELVLQEGGLDGFLEVPRSRDGWYQVFVAHAGAGSRYRWRIDGELQVPDPASRFNPEGPHAHGEVIDPRAFAWHGDWKGRPWHESVMYEMHVGSFTPEGTFAAAQEKLPRLAALGVTVIQLMPLADFPGRFGWGYDGVLPYAPHASYGRPEDLKRFIQAAHELQLMVMLDVVYNHFGPDGNYLARYAPGFFSTRHHTAWGAAVNFDGRDSAMVREFFIHNALYWLGEYRFDGLRFDAVHAILDDSSPDILASLSARVREAFPDRHVHLVQENDRNDPVRLGAPGTPGRFEGQWNGDFHHPLHVLLTGEGDGYYAEYTGDTMEQLARSLTHGFVWTGSPQPDGPAQPRRRAERPVPLTAMVNFLQNHDQVGNRAFGERLAQLVEVEPLRLVTALHLMHPGPPLLFMGEECGAVMPFLYFCDWQGELKAAVTEGRRREFAQFAAFSDRALLERIPDPCSETSFQRSKLDWTALNRPEGEAWRHYYSALLRLRHQVLVPHLPRLQLEGHEAEPLGPRALAVRWCFDDSMVLRALVNLSGSAQALPPGFDTGFMAVPALFRLGEVDAGSLGPWAGGWWWSHE